MRLEKERRAERSEWISKTQEEQEKHFGKNRQQQLEERETT